MRLRDLRGLPVIATDDARELGHVDTVVVEPSTATVVGFRMAKGGGVLPLDTITSTGADAVMVRDGDAVREAASPAERRSVDHDLSLLGRRVLTDHGDDLGPLIDLQVDTETGHIVTLALGDRMLAGDDLVGVGTHAVVVRHRSP